MPASSAPTTAPFANDDKPHSSYCNNVTFTNGTYSPDLSCPASQILASLQKGVYSTSRTINQTSIVFFDVHFERLVNSLKKVYPNFDVGSYSDVIRSLLVENARECINRFRSSRTSSKTEEYRVTFIIVAKQAAATNFDTFTKDFDVHVHATLMPPLPNPPIFANLRHFSRATPQVKDIQWTRDRKQLELEMPKGANETLLYDDQGHILEGLSSNFFVELKDGTIQTAGLEQVLDGTMRKAVLRCCAEIENGPGEINEEGKASEVVSNDGSNISSPPHAAAAASSSPPLQPFSPILISETAPCLSDISSWACPFITSTSRLVLPIHRLQLTENAQHREYQFQVTPTVQRIQRLVREYTKCRAFQLLR